MKLLNTLNSMRSGNNLYADTQKPDSIPPKKGGFRKVRDVPTGCRHPEHQPPMHIYLEPGVWEYICPGCGNVMRFTVPAIIL